jgi:hypothetical protein
MLLSSLKAGINTTIGFFSNHSYRLVDSYFLGIPSSVFAKSETEDRRLANYQAPFK